MPYDSQSFDWVVMSNCLGHIKHQEAALVEVHRVLKKSGKVIITDWTQDFLAMRLVNLYTQLFDYAEYNSLRSSETFAMMEKLHFECISSEKYKINWFWGLYTIFGKKR